MLYPISRLGSACRQTLVCCRCRRGGPSKGAIAPGVIYRGISPPDVASLERVGNPDPPSSSHRPPRRRAHPPSRLFELCLAHAALLLPALANRLRLLTPLAFQRRAPAPHDRSRAFARGAECRRPEPSAAIIDGQTVHATGGRRQVDQRGASVGHRPPHALRGGRSPGNVAPGVEGGSAGSTMSVGR